MLRFIPKSSTNAHGSYSDKPSHNILVHTGQILKQINEQRKKFTSSSNSINELKQLTIIYSLTLPSLLIYMQNCYSFITEEVIKTFEHICSLDLTILNELLEHKDELLTIACKSNNPKLFMFILDITKSQADADKIIFDIVKNWSMILLEYILDENIFPISEELTSKLGSIEKYLKMEANQLNNIKFFEWVYSIFGFQDEQAIILNQVCYSGGYDLLEHLIKIRNFDINAQMPDGSTALMSIISISLPTMDTARMLVRRKIINLLIDSNADLFIQRKDKNSVFQLALQIDDTITLCALDAKLKAQKRIEQSKENSPKALKSSVESQLRNIFFGDNLTILHMAIMCRAKKSITLLSRLLGANVPDKHGFNLACFALNINLPEEAEQLVCEFPELDLNATDENGVNILHRCAASSQRINSLKWLVDKKNYPLENKTSAGDAALLVAAISKNDLAIEYLLWETKRKPNVCVVNSSGNHIGHYLAISDNITLTIKLIKDPNYHLEYLARNIDGDNMLDKALSKGESHYPVVKASLIRIQRENKFIKKATVVAVRRKKFLIQYLKFLQHVEQNSDSGEFSKISKWIYDGQTPLHLLVVEFSITEVEKHVKRFKIDINVRNQKGQNVISYLLELNKFIKAQNFIIKFKPNITNIDDFDSSVLHIAVEKENITFLTWCLENFVLDILQPRAIDNKCALTLAIIQENLLISQLLWGRLTETQRFNYFQQASKLKKNFINHQLKYDPYNLEGVTLLHVAVRTADLELTKACLDTGQFSILEKNKFSRNALDIAINKQNTSICRLLFAKLSLDQQLDYFLTASTGKQEFLITQQIYNPNIGRKIEAVMESIFEEFVNDTLPVCSSIANEAHFEEEEAAKIRKSTEEYVIDNSVDQVVNEITGILILDAHQREQAKLANEKQALSSVIADVHRQLKASVRSSQNQLLISEIIHELIDSTLENVLEDEMRIVKAVTDRDSNFFRDLEDEESKHILLSKQASNIIHLAILQGNTRFTKYILDIKLISDHANFVHLSQAKHLNQKDIGKILVALPSVQSSIPVQQVQFKQTESEGFLSKPECTKNVFYAIVLDELAYELNTPEFKELKALMYGGGNIKETPGDLDILFAEINNIQLEDLASRFIDKLVETRGASRIVRTNVKNPAKSPKSTYFKVVAIEWLGCRVEFIITPLTKEQHSQGLDFTINALYYDIVNKQMYEVAGINSRQDFMHGIINTICPAEESFQDLRRIFRGIRIISLNQGFMFSFECFTVINRLFSGESNPFITNNMLLEHMFQQLSAIHSPEHNKFSNLFHLNALHILPKIIDFLRKKPGKLNAKIANSLELDQTAIAQQIMLQQQQFSSHMANEHTTQQSYSPRYKGPKNKRATKASKNGIFATNESKQTIHPKIQELTMP